jgi:hypothetical protein
MGWAWLPLAACFGLDESVATAHTSNSFALMRREVQEQDSRVAGKVTGNVPACNGSWSTACAREYWHSVDLTTILTKMHEYESLMGFLHPAAKATLALAEWRQLRQKSTSADAKRFEEAANAATMVLAEDGQANKHGGGPTHRKHKHRGGHNQSSDGIGKDALAEDGPAPKHDGSPWRSKHKKKRSSKQSGDGLGRDAMTEDGQAPKSDGDPNRSKQKIETSSEDMPNKEERGQAKKQREGAAAAPAAKEEGFQPTKNQREGTELSGAITLAVFSLVFGYSYQQKVTFKRRASLSGGPDFDPAFSLADKDIPMCCPENLSCNTFLHSFCCIPVRIGDTHQQLELSGCLCLGPFWTVVVMWLIITNWALLARNFFPKPYADLAQGGVHLILDIIFAVYLAMQKKKLRLALGQSEVRASNLACDTLLYFCCMPCVTYVDATQTDGAARTSVWCCCGIKVVDKDNETYTGRLLGEPVEVS